MKRIFRRLVAILMPQYCIKNKILRNNPNAWDYMPSVKAQVKAIAHMSDEDIANRLWDTATIRRIFHEKHIFWKDMINMEKRILMENFNSVRMALEQGMLEECNFRTVVSMYTEDVRNSSDKAVINCFEAVAKKDLKRGKSQFITAIATSDVGGIKVAYTEWLQAHDDEDFKGLDAEFTITMLDYLFGLGNWGYNCLLQPCTLAQALKVGIQSGHIYNEAIWLSIAYRQLHKPGVYLAVQRNWAPIMKYLNYLNNISWRNQLIERMLESTDYDNYDFVHMLYEVSESKPIASLCSVAKTLEDLERCSKEAASKELDATEKTQLGTMVVDKAISAYYNLFDVAIVGIKGTCIDRIIYILSVWGANGNQQKKIAKAFAYSELSDEQYNSLSDEMKKLVDEQLELRAEITMIKLNPGNVITHGIKLMPRAEKEFFMVNEERSQYWEEYINRYMLSEEGFMAMVKADHNAYFITKYAEKHGLSEWEYRKILMSSKRCFAPLLKRYCKK